MSREGRATKLSRALDPDKSQSVSVTLNAPQVEIVNRLYVSGLWGNSPAKVVRRLFDQACMSHAPKE